MQLTLKLMTFFVISLTTSTVFADRNAAEEALSAPTPAPIEVKGQTIYLEEGQFFGIEKSKFAQGRQLILRCL